jgi:hypothetical protein
MRGILAKTVVRDLLGEGDLSAPGGLALEKLEGLMVQADGTAIVVNDNDAVPDSNGETQVYRIPGIYPLNPVAREGRFRHAAPGRCSS